MPTFVHWLVKGLKRENRDLVGIGIGMMHRDRSYHMYRPDAINTINDLMGGSSFAKRNIDGSLSLLSFTMILDWIINLIPNSVKISSDIIYLTFNFGRPGPNLIKRCRKKSLDFSRH